MRHLVFALAMLAPLTALAQPSSGRDEFLRGNQAADELRWADALGHFERAYALSHNPVALYDAASTLRMLGRYVEARDALDRLEREHATLAPDLERGAAEMRSDVEPRIARFALELPDMGDLELRIDGRARDPAPRIEVDPGEHTLSASAPERVPFRWRGTLAPGATEELRIELDPVPRDATAEHWWIAVLSGAGGAVLIAAAIAIGLVVHDAAQLAPRTSVVLRP